MNHAAPATHNPATRSQADPRASLLRPAFIALFVQLQILLFASLLSFRDINFLQRIKIQLDFRDFFLATSDWLHHLNPYLRGRFVTPPPSLLVALPFQPLGIRAAGYAFFVLNLLLLAACLYALARHFRLPADDRLLLFGLASLFFPLIFLVDRGNVDGLMLALILVAVLARNPLVRGLALGASVALKGYSVLLFAPLALLRRWKTLAAAALTLGALLLGFHALLRSFLIIQRGRSADVSILENLSPAALLLHATEHHVVRTVFVLVLAALFLLMLYRTRNADPLLRSLYTLPWMLALPLHVFPYTGVLLLPLLVAWHADVRAGGRIARHHLLFLLGFLLTGTQQRAATEYFMRFTHSHQLFGLFNAFGTLLVMLAILIAPEQPTPTPAT